MAPCMASSVWSSLVLLLFLFVCPVVNHFFSNQENWGGFTRDVFHCRQYEHKIFHVLSGQLHVICKYTSFPVIQTCNTFQKKLGQEQFRASNEVNWLNNDVI